jgi:hypothetical protein
MLRPRPRQAETSRDRAKVVETETLLKVSLITGTDPIGVSKMFTLFSYIVHTNAETNKNKLG